MNQLDIFDECTKSLLAIASVTVRDTSDLEMDLGYIWDKSNEGGLIDGVDMIPVRDARKLLLEVTTDLEAIKIEARRVLKLAGYDFNLLMENTPPYKSGTINHVSNLGNAEA